MKTKNKVIMFIIVVLVVGAGYLAIDAKKDKTVITSGEIIGISDNTVDVLTGDIVNTFEFTSDKLKNHYVGEFVEISGDEKTIILSILIILKKSLILWATKYLKLLETKTN